MKIGNILKGHVNELLNRNEELYKYRIDICNACKLMSKEIIGKICSNKIYIDVDSDEVSNTPKPGFKKGCGCRLDAKTRDIDSVCPINKW